MENIGIIGIGGWGRNLLRTMRNLAGSNLTMACDLDSKRTSAAEHTYPGLITTQRPEDILENDDIKAVVIATPPSSHYELASKAMKNGKDVLVEKPLALSVSDGEKLLKESEELDRILMVGHIMVYHPATLYLKDLIKSGELGDIRYIYSSRVNLGKVRSIENSWWSFAPHDISIILYLLDAPLVRASSTGAAYLQDGIEDVVFTTLEFGDGIIAHIHVSWLDPHKERKVTIVGSKKMVVFDDTEATEKIRIYDKGADRNLDYDTYGEYMSIRSGDIVIPRIPGGEPLAAECTHFLKCIETREKPRSDGRAGLITLRALDAAQRSLGQGGAPVEIKA
ncbi:MAG: Gfo/Idh/MocA family oxidoreductase [candidate division Zixibacteria bacterium]|nr:Gfo/Idh/MocA family oxidoreductase [candidate division Zixibacteria bacterium]